MSSDLQRITDMKASLAPFLAMDPSIQLKTVLGFLFLAQYPDKSGRSAMRAMAKELNLNFVSAFRITHYWADKGYLSVDFDPDDKRLRIVSLTPKS